MTLNGNLNTAHETLKLSLEEIQKLWDKGEIRLQHKETLDKLASLKEIVNLAGEVASYIAKFNVISK